MTYPPPPMNAMLALLFGSISGDEYLRYIEMWRKKHESTSEKKAAPQAA